MGLTRIRADQIADIDYKQAVRVITLSNVTLSLGAPAQVDGVTLNQGDRVLVAGQSTATQNGLYQVDAAGTGSNGTWVRANDANATGEIQAGMIVMVTEGTVWADTSWKLVTNDPIAIGGTALIFAQNTGDSYSTIIANGTSIFANAVSSAITFTAGNNLAITGNATTDTVTFAVSDAPVFTGNLSAGNLSTTGNITGGNINVVGTTAATNKTTGALTVAGGVGVAGDVWAGNSITVDSGAYGNVVTTQFAGVFATASGPNPYSIVQVRSNDGTTGLGMQAYTGLNGLIYSNSGVTFQTGATIRDKDYPTGGTTRATIDSTGLSVTGIANISGNITGNYFIGNGSQLTGLAATYANANVVAYGEAGWAGNIIPAANNVYSLGSPTAQWASVYVSANTLYLGAVPISASNNTLVVGGNTVVTANATGTSTTTGNVSITGNITGSYILGNGSALTGIVAATATTAGTVTDNAQANITSVGTLTSLNSGVISSSGNVTGANILTAGIVSATGNITGSFIIGNGSQLTGLPAGYSNSNLASLGSNVISTTGTITGGNITGANILTGGFISATGNITGGNIVSGGGTGGNITGANVISGNTFTAVTVSTTGNITGSFIIGNGSQLTGLPAGYSNSNLASLGSNVISTTGTITGGNITGANILTGGFISATGNVSGNYILGNGSQLTGIAASYSNANVATFLAAFGSNTVSTTGNITTGNLLTGGLISATGNITTGNLLTGGLISATGNITGGNIVSGAGTGGNITGANVISGNTFNAVTVSASGNITGGNLTIGNIINSNANGIGNIGSSSTYFDTVFAKATSAQYADLAEMYCADIKYPPGTVVEFGGIEEVTQTTSTHSTAVAGIVSTHPSYLMNSTLDCATAVEVALVGRVPCCVVGTIAKGDRLVSSNLPGVATALVVAEYQPGCIVGKALEAYDSAEVGTIEVAVGRT